MLHKFKIQNVEYGITDYQLRDAITGGHITRIKVPLTIADVKVGEVFTYHKDNSVVLYIKPDAGEFFTRLASANPKLSVEIGSTEPMCMFSPDSIVEIFRDGIYQKYKD